MNTVIVYRSTSSYINPKCNSIFGQVETLRNYSDDVKQISYVAVKDTIANETTKQIENEKEIIFFRKICMYRMKR